MREIHKDGCRLASPVEHGQHMAIDDDMNPDATVPALFAEITALLEDAHEIAVRGQNSKLSTSEYGLCSTELRRSLDQIQTLAWSNQLSMR